MNQSEAQKLKWQDPEYRRHMSEAHMGKVPWNKGLTLLSSWNKGKPWSSEAKRKMSIARLGKEPANKGIYGVFLHSEETIKKMSESQKKVNNSGRFQTGRTNPRKGTGGNKHSWDAKYRSLKKTIILSATDLKEIEKFYLLAEMLTKSFGTKYCVDHIKPLSKGGLHHQSNLQVITLSDNSKKRDRYPFEVEERYFPGNTGDELYFCPENDWITLA